MPNVFQLSVDDICANAGTFKKLNWARFAVQSSDFKGQTGSSGYRARIVQKAAREIKGRFSRNDGDHRRLVRI